MCGILRTHIRPLTLSLTMGGARNQAYGGVQVTDPPTGVSKYTSPAYAPNQGFDDHIYDEVDDIEQDKI